MKATCYLSLSMLILLISCRASAQNNESPEQSLKIGLGIGITSSDDMDGIGIAHSLGYQREIWNGRGRLVPYFSIGHYSSKMIMDARDQYFSSIHLGTSLFVDLVRVKSISIVAGAGALVNHSKGLKGGGGDTDGQIRLPESEYVSDLCFGGYLGAGIRINPRNKRTAINILPFNIVAGTKYLAAFHGMLELDIKI